MNLTKSEKTYLTVAAVVIGAAVLWLAILNPLRLTWQTRNAKFSVAWRDFQETRTQLKTKKQLDKSLSALEKSMGVRVPSASPDEQLKSLVKEVEAVGEKNGIKFKNLTPRAETQGPTKRTDKTGAKIAFRLDFEANAQAFVRFLTDFQALTIPLVVESLDIRCQPSQPGSRGQPGPPSPPSAPPGMMGGMPPGMMGGMPGMQGMGGMPGMMGPGMPGMGGMPGMPGQPGPPSQPGQPGQPDKVRIALEFYTYVFAGS